MKSKLSMLSPFLFAGALTFTACEKEDQNLMGKDEPETNTDRPVIITSDVRETEEGENREDENRDRSSLDSFFVRKDRVFYPIIKPDFDPGPLDPEPDSWHK